MKVLVGNNRLATIGGSETYTYAMVKELQRQGHDVTVVTTGRPGPAARAIFDLNIPIFFNKVEGTYDIALLSHKTSIEAAKDVNTFKLQTCHGAHHPMEQPVKGMDQYVGVSEEVCSSLLKKGFTSTHIYNGIDCERFKSTRPINKKLTSILSLSQSKSVNLELSILCRKMGIEFMYHNNHERGSVIWDIETSINKADLVFTIGRGAYESMACGRNVILYDQRSYYSGIPIGDGFVNKGNVRDYLMYNCSGRFSKKRFTIHELIEETKKYDPQVGENLRSFALSELNIEHQVKKYLELLR